MTKQMLCVLFTFAITGCAERTADSLQGLTSTFPCLASNLGLEAGDCAAQDELVLVVTNGCAEPLTFPGVGAASTIEVAAAAMYDYPVPIQFVVGDVGSCSVSIPIQVGAQTGTISFRFE
ncbi:MAG TPA: hypothetical protein VIV11_33730 [Kofleriaceae bacterium]